MGADVEIAHITLVCCTEGFQHKAAQRIHAAQVVAAGHESFKVHFAAGKRIGHTSHIVGGGGRGVLLGDKAVTAHKQRTVYAFCRGREGKQTEKERQKRQDASMFHAISPSFRRKGL